MVASERAHEPFGVKAPEQRATVSDSGVHETGAFLKCGQRAASAHSVRRLRLKLRTFRTRVNAT